MHEQGTISIHTENIFPIIKKALYSERDIFLRELISNAVVAISKLKMVSYAGETTHSADPEIIVTIDKDLRCVHGAHYNPWKKEFIKVTEADAMMIYYQQLLMGDPVDNIKGIPKTGPKTSEKLLADCHTHEQYRKAVIDAYMAAFGMDNWYEQLELNGKLIHILRHKDDIFTTEEWF